MGRPSVTISIDDYNDHLRVEMENSIMREALLDIAMAPSQCSSEMMIERAEDALERIGLGIDKNGDSWRYENQEPPPPLTHP